MGKTGESLVSPLKQAVATRIHFHFSLTVAVWCMPPRRPYHSASAASSGRAPEGRERSRSPDSAEPVTSERIEQLKETYRKCREQKRGGKQRKRRLKGVCCGLLRFLIQLCIQIVQQSSSAADPRLDIYKKRQRQAERRLQEVIDGWLPRRDQSILDLGEDSEAESEIREELAISSGEEEGEEQESDTLTGVWLGSASDRSSRIRSAPRISISTILCLRGLISNNSHSNWSTTHCLNGSVSVAIL